MGSKTSFHPGAGTALLIIDPQVDFCPGGALAVPGGDEIIPVINRYVELFDARRLPIYVSRDWHPSETAHFLQSGGQWPPHCVQGSAGAAFHPDLRLPADAVIVSKGMDSRRGRLFPPSHHRRQRSLLQHTPEAGWYRPSLPVRFGDGLLRQMDGPGGTRRRLRRHHPYGRREGS